MRKYRVRKIVQSFGSCESVEYHIESLLPFDSWRMVAVVFDRKIAYKIKKMIEKDKA